MGGWPLQGWQVVSRSISVPCKESNYTYKHMWKYADTGSGVGILVLFCLGVRRWMAWGRQSYHAESCKTLLCLHAFSCTVEIPIPYLLPCWKRNLCSGNCFLQISRLYAEPCLASLYISADMGSKLVSNILRLAGLVLYMLSL